VPEPEERSSTVVGKGQDVWELLVAYAKQETVEPLKGLGRWVAAGAGGSLLIATGLSLLLLSALRALQTETGTTFTGNWSWAPYAIMAGVLAIGVTLLALTMRAEKGEA
jgi:hypothetical protein